MQKPQIVRKPAPFKVDGLAIPYPEFVPRLFNLCLSLGFRKELIMPSRAFCSDENQGLPIILMTKHFGTFPFNHGRVGGIIASDRHGPHAHHGVDSVILQASHVGYDPNTGIYGKFIRPRMGGATASDSCGKIAHVIRPYIEQYEFAREQIFLHQDNSGRKLITIKNSFLDFTSQPVKKGLVLLLEKIAEVDEARRIVPVASLSTSQTFAVAEDFGRRLDDAGYLWKGEAGECIGKYLFADLFQFREDFRDNDDSILLERSLAEFMPTIVTSANPPLKAAIIIIQLEFTRIVESIHWGGEYAGKNLLYITGLNIDISEFEGFPATTYFVPWAAYVQLSGDAPEDYSHPLEQDHLFKLIMEQKIENPAQIDLKDEISRMLQAPRFDIRSPQE
ncbi:MAG TPA: hypothetical protein EYP64_01875 [Desulfarculaceae bacterium]|nr:hypothetical protein [Desulfarculaceae bacterium]